MVDNCKTCFSNNSEEQNRRLYTQILYQNMLVIYFFSDFFDQRGRSSALLQNFGHLVFLQLITGRNSFTKMCQPFSFFCFFWLVTGHAEIVKFINMVHSLQFHIWIRRFKRLKKIRTVYVTTNTFALKERKWIEAIFCLGQHLSLSHYVKFQSDHTHFSKLCLLKRIVLYKKQNFRVFKSTNIRNENQQVNKSHFLSCTTYLSINLIKI